MKYFQQLATWKPIIDLHPLQNGNNEKAATTNFSPRSFTHESLGSSEARSAQHQPTSGTVVSPMIRPQGLSQKAQQEYEPPSPYVVAQYAPPQIPSPLQSAYTFVRASPNSGMPYQPLGSQSCGGTCRQFPSDGITTETIHSNVQRYFAPSSTVASTAWEECQNVGVLVSSQYLSYRFTGCESLWHGIRGEAEMNIRLIIQ